MENIPDVDVPLTDVPDGAAALEDISDVDVPLTDLPGEDADLEDISDVDVPLSDIPQTGDNSQIWVILTLISGAGLVWLVLEDRKREKTAK